MSKLLLGSTLARCRQNKLHSDGFLKSNYYTRLLYELTDLIREMDNFTSRVIP